MMGKLFLSASSSRWLGGILILDSHMPSVSRVLWVAGGRRTVASELASSKWLLPQIDLHRWEEVFQVGTGTTPDRKGGERERGGTEGVWERRHRGPSVRAQPWGSGEELQAIGLKLSTEPPVSMIGKHRPCQPIVHASHLTAPPYTPRQHRKNLEDGADGTWSQPGLDERLETEKREGLSN